ncbi:hypothetical protein PIB30_057226 [Stylosanthes scabra]|uniref:Uncharacterized protein n=1 Tax=Stylosanthes scabra TaxID=79078 RepID=A0ABU6QK99_9FABA|nr:hypothetical protein [Stylosanthes scabra]
MHNFQVTSKNHLRIVVDSRIRTFIPESHFSNDRDLLLEYPIGNSLSYNPRLSMAAQGKNQNVELKISLKIYSRDYDTIIEDPEDPFNPEKILFPFTVEDKLYCFVSPLMSKEEAEK